MFANNNRWLPIVPSRIKPRKGIDAKANDGDKIENRRGNAPLVSRNPRSVCVSDAGTPVCSLCSRAIGITRHPVAPPHQSAGGLRFDESRQRDARRLYRGTFWRGASATRRRAKPILALPPPPLLSRRPPCQPIIFRGPPQMKRRAALKIYRLHLYRAIARGPRTPTVDVALNSAESESFLASSSSK